MKVLGERELYRLVEDSESLNLLCRGETGEWEMVSPHEHAITLIYWLADLLRAKGATS